MYRTPYFETDAIFEGSFILTELTYLDTGINLKSVIDLSVKSSCSALVSWMLLSIQVSYISRGKIANFLSYIFLYISIGFFLLTDIKHKNEMKNIRQSPFLTLP
jgi:hypothetical protein